MSDSLGFVRLDVEEYNRLKEIEFNLEKYQQDLIDKAEKIVIKTVISGWNGLGQPIPDPEITFEGEREAFKILSDENLKLRSANAKLSIRFRPVTTFAARLKFLFTGRLNHG